MRETDPGPVKSELAAATGVFGLFELQMRAVDGPSLRVGTVCRLNLGGLPSIACCCRRPELQSKRFRTQAS